MRLNFPDVLFTEIDSSVYAHEHAALSDGFCKGAIVTTPNLVLKAQDASNCAIKVREMLFPSSSSWVLPPGQSYTCVARAIGWALRGLQESGELAALNRNYLAPADCSDIKEVNACCHAILLPHSHVSLRHIHSCGLNTIFILFPL
jgi:hypothetical protein